MLLYHLLMKQKIFLLLFFIGLGFLIRPGRVLAQLGAGVGLGLIDISKPLTPGGIYKLPRLPVINTGEIEAVFLLKAVPATTLEPNYLTPKLTWFNFSPKNFKLQKNESKMVNVSLSLPFDAPAGQYAALLEASATPVNKQGQVQVGPAAATKIYFSVGVAPGVLGAMRQRLNSYWTLYQPWTYLILMAVNLLLILSLLNFLFRFSLGFRIERRQKSSNTQKPKQ